MKKMILMAAILLGSTSAFANIAIECGKSVDEDGVVSQPEFMISAEGEKPFTVYNKNGQALRNATVSQQKNGDIVVNIYYASGMSGKIGNKYVIKYQSGYLTVPADKTAVGGFAGGSKVGTLQCSVTEV